LWQGPQSVILSLSGGTRPTAANVKTRKNYMTLSEATAIVTAAIGRSISYSAIAGGEYRNFTILSVDKVACAIKTGNWYVVANVIDHDNADLEKVRSLHIDGIF